MDVSPWRLLLGVFCCVFTGFAAEAELVPVSRTSARRCRTHQVLGTSMDEGGNRNSALSCVKRTWRRVPADTSVHHPPVPARLSVVSVLTVGPKLTSVCVQLFSFFFGAEICDSAVSFVWNVVYF